MEKKRYWLKLDKDFLKSSQIKVIKNMPNGKDYIIFYLSLLLESVETVGHLRFSDLVPYNAEMLASITDTNVDIVRNATNLFESLGLLEILDDGTIYMTQVAEMTGKESESAERVRQYRLREKQRIALHCNENVTECNVEVTDCNGDVTKCNDNKEKKKEKDKQRTENKEQRTENKENKQEEISTTPTNARELSNLDLFSFIEQVFGRTLSGSEYEIISLWEDNELTRYAVKQAELARAFNVKYIQRILSSYQKDGITTVIEAEERDRRYQLKKENASSGKSSYQSKQDRLREKFMREDEANEKN